MGEIVERAKVLRAKIEQMSQSVITEDEEAADYSELFPQWDGNGIEYAVGFKCRYNGILYKVLQAIRLKKHGIPLMLQVYLLKY